ncbi:MAG: SDR family NAD(P)-dependent oxidoreductase [Bacillota bacterium]
MLLLEGKSVIVTGGTGAVGSALCDVLSREGADIAFNFEKSKDKAEQVLCKIKENGRKGLAFQCSVLDKEAVASMVRTVEEEFGKIDILVNNAGVVQVMPFPLIEEEEWDMVMDVNVKGMFIVSKEVVRHMVMQRSGVIINMGSIGGVRLLEVPVHYAASKAAVSGFSIALAKELARYNIRVNTVVPGMLSGGVGLNVPEKQYNEYMKYCAAARPGKPEEVADYVAFLASDRAAYINAQNLIIDGGL